ncbi:MAG: energy transducer TonB [Devosia sp.]|jgi:protein TonB|nr:energy transducer TonB [Devosia sp.]
MSGTLATRQIETFERGLWRDLLLWTSAFVIVIGTQAGAAYWFANRPPEPVLEGGLPDAIMLELAPISTSAENALADMPPDQQTMVEQSEVAPSELPEDEVIDPQPEPEQVPPEPEEPPEEVEPDPVPEPSSEITPEPVEPLPEELPEPEEPVVEPPEQVIPDLVEAPEPAVVAPMPVQASASLQERRRRPKPIAARPPAQQAAPRTAAPPPSAAPRAQTAASTQPAARQAAPSVSPARWQSQLMSHLNRRKQYPRSSQSRREEGVVQLKFALDKAGNVVSSSIARSSGYPDLDRAVLAMIGRASPVPAPPAEFVGKSITIPIEFRLAR